MTFYGVPSCTLTHFLQKQKRPDWCWAASLSMLFSFAGVEFPQERIVEGSGLSDQLLQSGQSEHINNFLQRDFTAPNGKIFRLFCQRYMARNLHLSTLAEHLRLDRPALIGMHIQRSGSFHLVVCTGATIDADELDSIDVLDPWDPNIQAWKSNEIRLVDIWLITLQEKRLSV